MPSDRWLTYNNKALSYNNKGIQYPFTREDYFDFGSTYTLSTLTEASIDLTRTALPTATMPYISFYMDIRCTRDYENEDGSPQNGILIGTSAGSDPVAGVMFALGTPLYSGLSIVPLFRASSLPQAGSPIGGGSPTTVTRLRITVFFQSPYLSWTYDYYQNGTWTNGGSAYRASSAPLLPASANVFTRIASTGNEEGRLSATNFKCAGFMSLEDARSWDPGAV